MDKVQGKQGSEEVFIHPEVVGVSSDADKIKDVHVPVEP